MKLMPDNAGRHQQILIFFLLLYVALIALPFVPGIEMGFALLILAGPGSAVLVYGCTVLGLSLSFLVGYLLPTGWLKIFSDYLFLTPLSHLIERMEPLDTRQRLSLLLDHMPTKALPLLLRHRYVAVALALNVPGNALLGGGGGISLLAGWSRLYAPSAYLLMVSLAVAPLPIAVWLYGKEILVP